MSTTNELIKQMQAKWVSHLAESRAIESGADERMAREAAQLAMVYIATGHSAHRALIYTQSWVEVRLGLMTRHDRQETLAMLMEEVA